MVSTEDTLANRSRIVNVFVHVGGLSRVTRVRFSRPRQHGPTLAPQQTYLDQTIHHLRCLL